MRGIVITMPGIADHVAPEWRSRCCGIMITNERHPHFIKETFQECWRLSDNQASFTSALREQGYVLARGDRRGFVALDFRGEVYAVSKWVGIRTKEVRAKLSEESALPSVAEAGEKIADDVYSRLQELTQEGKDLFQAKMAALQEKQRRLRESNKVELEALTHRHEERHILEVDAWSSAFRRGLWGLLDRLTGRYGRIKQEVQLQKLSSQLRDREELTSVKTGYSRRLHHLKLRIGQTRRQHRDEVAGIVEDLQILKAMREDALQDAAVTKKKQTRRWRSRKGRPRGPERSR